MSVSYIADGHCDTLTRLLEENNDFADTKALGQLDLLRMQKAGINIQFFAAFISPKYKDNSIKRCLQLIDAFYTKVLRDSSAIGLALNVGDIDKLTKAGKIAALLSVEGGEALNGELAVLRMYYRLGVRSITLTWNGRNELADGVGEGVGAGGLSLIGRAVVQEMNKLGMLIDVSHLSPSGFWDVAELSDAPFAATHANVRAICDHSRNLDDAQLKQIAGSGGIIGLTFVPEFIDHNSPCLSALLKHIDYIAGRWGTACIGLGSDFDGMDHQTKDLADVSDTPRLAEALLRQGYTDEQTEGIMGKNWINLLSKVLK